VDPLAHFTETSAGPDAARELVSPFCKIVVRNHPETLLSFSAINCPPGKFFTSRIFATVPQNVVFLNCPKNSWYLDGIPGLGDSLPAAAESLRRLLEHLGLGGTRKICWGGSMGGYGAVTFGALLDAETIVATGAELALMVAGGNTELILGRIQGRTDLPELPIADWISGSRGRFFLYSGEFAYHDLVSALKIAPLPQVRITTLRDFGHPLPGYIEDVHGLHPFLMAHAVETPPVLFDREETGILNDHQDWWADLHAVSMNLPEAAADRISAGLDRMTPLPAEVAGHCGYALSKGASLRGDHTAAVDFARRAIGIAGPGRFLTHRLAMALRAAGAPLETWMKSAVSIQNLESPNRFEFGDQVIETIVRDHLAAGNPTGAARFISRQKPLSRQQPARLALLGRLLTEAVGPNEWQVAFHPRGEAAFSRRVLDHPQAVALNQRVTLTGAVLAESPQDQLAEVLLPKSAGKIVRFHLLHESPGLAKLRPDLPHAANVRFKIELRLRDDPPESITLGGKTVAGKSIDWLTLTRKPTAQSS
jgi:hypothetical protein